MQVAESIHRRYEYHNEVDLVCLRIQLIQCKKHIPLIAFHDRNHYLNIDAHTIADSRDGKYGLALFGYSTTLTLACPNPNPTLKCLLFPL